MSNDFSIKEPAADPSPSIMMKGINAETNSPKNKLSMRNFLQKQRKQVIDPRSRVIEPTSLNLDNKISAKVNNPEQKHNSSRQLIPNTVFLQRDPSQRSRIKSPSDKQNSHSKVHLKSENNTRIILRSLDKYAHMGQSSSKARGDGKSFRELKVAKSAYPRLPKVDRILAMRAPHPSSMDWFNSYSQSSRIAGSVTTVPSLRSLDAEPKTMFKVRKLEKSDVSVPQKDCQLVHGPILSQRQADSQKQVGGLENLFKLQDTSKPGSALHSRSQAHRRNRISGMKCLGQLPNSAEPFKLRQEDRIKEISEIIKLQNLSNVPLSTSLDESSNNGAGYEGLFFKGADRIDSTISSSMKFGSKMKSNPPESYQGSRIHNYLDKVTLDRKLNAMEPPQNHSQNTSNEQVKKNRQLEEEIMKDLKKMMKRELMQ
jgi:hypothetical protein